MPKNPVVALFLLILGTLAVRAEDAPAPPEDPELAKIFGAGAAPEPKRPPLDRTRGRIVFKAKEGQYIKGEHFGRWNWPAYTAERWGSYLVEVTHVSQGPKMGLQFFVGESRAKGYVAQSGSIESERTAVLAPIYIPDTATYPAGILSGDDSNGDSFQLRQVALVPAPEGAPSAQGIDGSITLAAASATTFSKKMRYEPKPEKNCLGFWTDKEDWAEWPLSVHDGGKFELEVFYGCATGNEGSEVSVWVDDRELNFKVEDTGGFQSWRGAKLGKVDFTDGKHVLTIKPKTQTGKAVMDVQKVVLTPVD